jgi:hypothetical protein
MTRARFGLLLLFVFSAAGLNTAWAQDREVRLDEPAATFAEAFALVNGLREMPDGRVMVADPLGQVLLIADLETGKADTLGGVGQGPEEYRQPDGLFSLPGDRTLLVDLGNARLTVIGADGRFGETTPLTQGSPGAGLLIILPQGTDARGGVYFEPMGGRMPSDSSAVVLWDRSTGTQDTVVLVALPEMKRSTSGGPGNQNVRIMPIPLAPEDAWAVAWDGRIAVARVGDYHVEWIHPDGKIVRGPPVDYEAVRIREADKEEWAEGLGNGLRIGVSIDNGERRVTMGRGGGGGGGPDLDAFEWPDDKPPFVANGVWVTPEGDAWVERSGPAGEPVQFDVFGADAQLKGSVILPAGCDLVGFGDGSVYVVRTDDLGLQWLERYKRKAT